MSDFLSDIVLERLQRRAMRHGFPEEIFKMGELDEDLDKFLDNFTGSRSENGVRVRLKNSLLNYVEWKKPFAATLFSITDQQLKEAPNVGKVSIELFHKRKREIFGSRVYKQDTIIQYEEKLEKFLHQIDCSLGKEVSNKLLQVILDERKRGMVE
jgi:hypothetical protein